MTYFETHIIANCKLNATIANSVLESDISQNSAFTLIFLLHKHAVYSTDCLMFIKTLFSFFKMTATMVCLTDFLRNTTLCPRSSSNRTLLGVTMATVMEPHNPNNLRVDIVTGGIRRDHCHRPQTR